MMSEKLIKAIGDIDERFILEADKDRVKHAVITPIKRNVYKSVAAAACIALVGVGALSTMSKNDRFEMKEMASEAAPAAEPKMSMIASGNTTTTAAMEDAAEILMEEELPTEGAMEAINDTAATVATVINPMRGVTFAQMTEELHLKVTLPEGAAENNRYIYDLGDEKLGEVNFAYDGKEYSLRVQKTEELSDIAGLYYTFDVDDTAKGTWLRLCTSEQVGSISWYNNEYTYCLIMTQDASRDALENMYGLVMDALHGKMINKE